MLKNYGIKQAGSISPELYKYYEETIATILYNLKLVKYGKLIIDILMYADDIMLVAPSHQKMQQMLDEVSKFSITHQIRFNPNRTMLLIFNDVIDNNIRELDYRLNKISWL